MSIVSRFYYFAACLWAHTICCFRGQEMIIDDMAVVVDRGWCSDDETQVNLQRGEHDPPFRFNQAWVSDERFLESINRGELVNSDLIKAITIVDKPNDLGQMCEVTKVLYWDKIQPAEAANE